MHFRFLSAIIGKFDPYRLIVPMNLKKELSENKIQNLKDDWGEVIKRSNFDSTIVSILMREILPETHFLFSNDI